MVNDTEPVSAFAVYSMKRKSDDSLKPKNVKKIKNKKKNPTDGTSICKDTKSTNNGNNTSTKKKLIIEQNGNDFKFTDSVDKRTEKVKPVTFEKKSKNANKLKKVAKNEKNKKLEKIEKLRHLKQNKAKIVSNAQHKAVNNSNEEKTKNTKLKKKKNNLEQIVSNDEDFSVNPLKKSKLCFEWLISPISADDFLEHSWEQQPVHIKRKDPDYYKFLLSTPMLDTILREQHVLFTKNLDVTSYTNGIRETHNPPGRALPSIVWDFYGNDCSIRMLNPQTFVPQLHDLNAILQEFFGCFVGANSYLTPPNSQGFAPHYDDIEAFILQVEGKKRWRLYKPRNEEFLARFSSKNFEQSELGELIMDTVLNAGDLLYFPRGTIHQGETIDDTHSLHITLSVYQKNCWTDLFEKLLPKALAQASKLDYRYRQGLPVGSTRFMGYVNSSDRNSERKAFLEKAKLLLDDLINYADVDEAVDEMAKGHLHDFLPPVLRDEEQRNSVIRDGWIVRNEGIVEERVDIRPDTRIRLLRSHCIRLLEEEDSFKIYYSTENSKEYHEHEPQFFEIERYQVPVIKEIILQYPNYIKVENLPNSEIDIDVKLGIVHDLWEKCLIVTDGPLPRDD